MENWPIFHLISRDQTLVYVPKQANKLWKFPPICMKIITWNDHRGTRWHIMALESTEPLTEKNTRNISWGARVKAVGAYG